VAAALLMSVWLSPTAAADLEDDIDRLWLQASDGAVRHRELVAPSKDSLIAMGELAIPHLLSFLYTEDARERHAITDIFEGIGPVATPALLEAMGTGGEYHTLNILRAFGKIADSAASPRMSELLDDSLASIRGQAAEAIGKSGGPLALASLYSVLHDSIETVRKSAVVGLGRIAKPEATDSLIQALSDPWYGVRYPAALSVVSTVYGTTLELKRAFPWSALPAANSLVGIRNNGWNPSLVDPRSPDSVALDRVVFLDIETTGLSIGAGTVAFLVGLVWADQHGMQLRQYLMRDFSEEAAQQEALSRTLSRFETVVTYNGASFDIPVLRTRAIMNRVSAAWLECSHVDLLHPVRAIWKRAWSDCRLQTAEQQLLGVIRTDDCEGWEVPLRYREFLTMQHEEPLLNVLEHNAQDLLSLACLMAHVQRLMEPDHDGFGMSQEELFGLARALSARGRTEESARMLQLGRSMGRLSPHYGRAMRTLVRHLKRANLLDDARVLWSELQTSPDPLERYWAWIEEAKFAEHQTRDFAGAMCATSNAARTLMELPDSPTLRTLRSELEHRRNRLKSRQNAG
jgi:hypothetical protein